MLPDPDNSKAINKYSQCMFDATHNSSNDNILKKSKSNSCNYDFCIYKANHNYFNENNKQKMLDSCNQEYKRIDAEINADISNQNQQQQMIVTAEAAKEYATSIAEAISEGTKLLTSELEFKQMQPSDASSIEVAKDLLNREENFLQIIESIHDNCKNITNKTHLKFIIDNTIKNSIDNLKKIKLNINNLQTIQLNIINLRYIINKMKLIQNQHN
jgi:vacuolar-type H+-ATPase subunit E/Vma4